MVIFWDGEVIILQNTVFYLAGDSAALRYAGEYLEFSGAQIAQCPDDRVTHLLLPVPSFENGRVKGGWKLEPILATLPGDITVIGGNADHPALARYCRLDLLQDPFYLAENADITAHCAVKLALSRLPVSLKNQSVLVIGWGRIGKCLARLLRIMGAEVAVQARKQTDQAMLAALGYAPPQAIDKYRILFNTVPAMMIDEGKAALCRSDCLKIDLASVPGIVGSDVIWARGLPGTEAPESSGQLIARTVIRLLKEGAV
jgi:dipicolinate synthase subunit A